MYITYDLAIPLLNICPREILPPMQIYSKTFSEVLLVIHNKNKTQKQRKSNPLGEEKINKALCDILHSN